MNAIMIDNWSVLEIFINSNFNDDVSKLSEEYRKLLSTLVLWDDIYFPSNEKTYKNIMNRYNDIFKSINDTDKLFESKATDIYKYYFKGKESKIVAKEGIRYLMLSSYKGLDYFPSINRCLFFDKYNILKDINQMNRLDFIKILDKEINDYFLDYNDKFGKKIFEIQRPVLSDFIIQNTPYNISHIEFAIQMRKEKSVRQYKKYLNDLEKALENREWKKLNELIELSHDIVKNTVNMDKKSIGTLEISLFPFPSFSFSREINFKKKKINVAFLEKLSRYAFNGRKI